MKWSHELTLFEKIWLSIFTVLNVVLFFMYQDTIVSLVASLTGMICVLLAAKGNISNYLFGFINISLYSILAFSEKFYGEFLLNVLYFLPMQIIGFYLWKKNQLGENREVIVKDMKKSSLVRYGFITIAATVIVGFIFKKIGGHLPYLDSFANILQIIALYLMVKCYVEQWYFWILTNLATVIMWLITFIEFGGNIGLVIMWIAYLVNSIYGHYSWLRMKKEQGENSSSQIAI